jgi:hypothetical protein
MSDCIQVREKRLVAKRLRKKKKILKKRKKRKVKYKRKNEKVLKKRDQMFCANKLCEKV